MSLEDEILAMLAEIRGAGDRIDMSLEALYQAIESSGNFREGYYSLRKVRDLNKTVAAGIREALQYTGRPLPELAEFVAFQRQQVRNVLATIQEEIERVER